MQGLMQQALGEAWHRLPPALQAHHLPGSTRDVGQLAVEHPGWVGPVLHLAWALGVRLPRRAPVVDTRVDKTTTGQRQQWRRTLRLPDGRVQRFDSAWVPGRPGRIVEFVNGWLGLEIAPQVVDGRLHYRGTWHVVRIGRHLVGLPEWLLLGHTTIVEEAVDARHFRMDFRLRHPLLGETYRYAGVFRTDVEPDPPA